jgi:16S rRNA processing protein RimM
LIEVGRVARPHGVAGEIKVAVPGDFLDVINHIETVFLGRNHTPKRVLASREHQHAWLLMLDGVTSRDAAEALRGQSVWITDEDLPELDDGQYYEFELLGLRAIEANTGATLGEIVEVLATGSNDVYVIRKADGRDLLLPAIESVVKLIDLDAGTVSVVIPDGL